MSCLTIRRRRRHSILAVPSVFALSWAVWVLGADPDARAAEVSLETGKSGGEPASRNALYLELFGKGGLWGVGYDRLFVGDRLGAGAAASFYALDGQSIRSFSPYLSFYPLIAGASRWFLQAGPQFSSQSVRSPVPEWQGTRSMRAGGQLSSGYEFRDGFLFRVYGMVSAGAGGVAPWVGLSGGWAF